VPEVLPEPAVRAPVAGPGDPAAVIPVPQPRALVLKRAVVPKRAVMRPAARQPYSRNPVKPQFHRARAT
jgi:hypothetical protein